MNSDQAFVIGIVGSVIGAVTTTVAGWTASASLWIAVTIFVLGAAVGMYGLVMLWRSWCLHTPSTSNQ